MRNERYYEQRERKFAILESGNLRLDGTACSDELTQSLLIVALVLI